MRAPQGLPPSAPHPTHRPRTLSNHSPSHLTACRFIANQVMPVRPPKMRAITSPMKRSISSVIGQHQSTHSGQHILEKLGRLYYSDDLSNQYPEDGVLALQNGLPSIELLGESEAASAPTQRSALAVVGLLQNQPLRLGVAHETVTRHRWWSSAVALPRLIR